ncbi:DUF72 domain-containing protein [Salisediminibacterium selenitireducens]|uniref:DUF72 domain-containing protein n=1 Tax=Bacillus selenitireducens (strain ATCC 700615 / DSM 15326 / MLS10) TaxID=439292 RepID=D6Y170_BACIE|nr:DUF72 domain-containing protein [Salisediminibacterium selenitireducens]ADH98674.1 protein of unknown function DUF72 [[Bacillus] selenitireducens MLS10]
MRGQIYIGCTGWGDHDSLYEGGTPPSQKLSVYASHFPSVELDASFYAVPSEQQIAKWIRETPETFRFVVKAYQGMTGHMRGENPFPSKIAMYDAFDQALKPMQDQGKLAMVLFQFPPWFDVKKEHVSLIKGIRERYHHYDLALEFRHRSWFEPPYRDKTLALMKEGGWIHSICDEPQAGEKSIPFVPVATTGHRTLIRLHGRNVAGWNYPAKGDEWRDVRYLYDYSEEELKTLAKDVKAIHAQSSEVYVIFNNNSGGHAAANAKRLKEILGITYDGLNPAQLKLF